MKHIKIKSALMRTVAVMLLTLGTSSASAQYYYLNVFQKNGGKVQYVIADLDSINVTKMPLSVSLDKDELSLTENGQAKLTATVKYGNREVNETVSWSSDKDSVATVSTEGLVTAIAAGTATITATYQDKTANCVVTVREVQEFVDLGLSVKWATCNVGATKPEEYGDYYAWGETETKTDYSSSNYKWYEDSCEFSLTKYNTNSYYDYGTVDGKYILDLEDDIAHVKCGGNWRMPTNAEQDELCNNCTWTWYSSGNTEFNGVAGYKVTSKKEGYTDRSIFLPAAGYRWETDLYGVGLRGYYWSSSLKSDYKNNEDPAEVGVCAYFLGYNSSSDYGYIKSGFFERHVGQTVRPVCPYEYENLSISLDSMSLSMVASRTYSLKVTVFAGDSVLSGAVPRWESDNVSVAKVSEKGLVTAVAAGTATITATYQDKTAYCVVTVREVQYEYVDLGLSVKWATFNVGATKPEECGDYYAWGETETKKYYSLYNYKWYNGDYAYIILKYNTDDNKTILDLEDDIAHLKCGGNWRMPTNAEQDELCNNCTWTWTTLNGVHGYRVTSNKTGYTDRSIFLPAAGNYYDTRISFVGSYGRYWSSSRDTDDPSTVGFLGFDSGSVATYYDNRYRGLSVRPVCP